MIRHITQDAINRAYEELANAVVITAAKDYRESRNRMHTYELRADKQRDIVRKTRGKAARKKEESKLLRYMNKIDSIRYDMNTAKEFFKSERFSMFSKIDGCSIVERIDREVS